MIKRFIIAFVLLVLICGGIVGFNILRDRGIQQYFANLPRPALTVSTAEVKPVTWRPGIEALGTVAANRGVDLTVETTGIIKDIMFSANEHVENNQVLVQLDDLVERADLEAAKAQANLDKVSLDRALQLQKRGVGSEVSVETANAAATTSAAQVAKLQAVLDQKQLRAPFEGTMGIPKIDDGQYLAPGTIVATLQDLETMRADFTVPEQQLDQLKIGQAVRLGVNQQDFPFQGKVTGIDPKVDPTSRLVSVRAEVSNPEGRLSPGQFVQVEVQLPEETGVIAVAQTAVVTSLYGDYIYIVVKEDAKEPAKPADAQAPAAPAADETATPTSGATTAADEVKEPALVARQVFVKTGRRSRGVVEILSGISAGDIVVTAGQNRLSNGSSVKIDNTVTPDDAAASK